MKTTSAISTAALFALTLAGLSSPAQEAVAPAGTTASDDASARPQTPVSANSKVRIVRLSEVKGQVQLDRVTGKGFEGAMANLPLTEGSKLKTEDGVAEVEFEDNSTVRLAQNSLVEFPRLELLPSGAKASAVNVLQGTVYVSLVNTKGNEFSVKFGPDTMNLPPDSHVRLQLTQTEATVAVMHGDALIEQPSGSTTVGKNKTATFNLAAQSPPEIAKNIVEQPLDKWDGDAVQYHKSYANASAFGGSPYSYGINDLNYYGSFTSGCGGSMWRPYFTNASWDPYGSGAWAYYPSAGYSWVSPYPWGWTPYHYGSWSFCQGIGWGWRPGGAWMGLANNSFVNSTGGTSGPTSGPVRPHPPTHAPLNAETSLVPVNLKSVPASGLSAHDTFVFRNNSAGLGVPRASLGKLNSFANQTAQHGMATTSVYYAGKAARYGGERKRGCGRVVVRQQRSSEPVLRQQRSSEPVIRRPQQHAKCASDVPSGAGPSGGSGGGGHR